MEKILFSCLVIVMFTVSGCSTNKPSEDKIKTSIKKIMPIEPQISSIKELDYFPGLVEVVVMIDGKPIVFYTDRKGDYIVSGSILKAENKQNMTQEVMKTLASPAPAVTTTPAPAKK